MTAGSIANLALLAYLRYPVSLWGIGVGQCANRLIWLLRHGRRRGILKGVTMIPAHLRANHRYRLPVSKGALRSYLALREPCGSEFVRRVSRKGAERTLRRKEEPLRLCVSFATLRETA